ncbi:Iron-sulfur assembly protein 1 [Elasticomyces elasticus]|nr:Iron-sulfur assembly protein 1 [Elasticomyces elasticus]
MSLTRPFAATTFSLLRTLAVQAPPRHCPECLRLFSPYRPFSRSSRRQLQTATAYRPHALTQDLPPPRNAGVPNTSIAGGVANVDEARTRKEVDGRGQDAQAQVQAQAPKRKSVTEGEAQRTEAASSVVLPSSSQSPASSTTSTPQEEPPAKPRRSRLRARKAAMTLTPLAVSQLRALLDQPEPKLIRVGVKNRGCSGLAYHLEYVDKPGAFDESVEQDDVKVLIDSRALFSIIGSEMDWVEDKLSARFVFRNPNITEQCGCGESFSIS